MKPFERDDHAAQLSVGFHAKPANLTCIVSLEQPATRSTLRRRRGSPCMTACISGGEAPCASSAPARIWGAVHAVEQAQVWATAAFLFEILITVCMCWKPKRHLFKACPYVNIDVFYSGINHVGKSSILMQHLIMINASRLTLHSAQDGQTRSGLGRRRSMLFLFSLGPLPFTSF